MGAVAQRSRHRNPAVLADPRRKAAAAERRAGEGRAVPRLGRPQAAQRGQAAGRRAEAGPLLVGPEEAWAPDRGETTPRADFVRQRRRPPSKLPTPRGSPKRSADPDEPWAKDRPETSVGQVAESGSLF